MSQYLIKKLNKNSKRGYVELIIVLLLVGFAITILIMVNAGEKGYDKDLGKIDMYADKVIESIERDGYITDEIKFDIESFIDGTGFDYIDISGTESQVESGDRVLLRIEVYNKNLRGGILNRNKISKEGIAK